jgi:hypothetical protein
MAFVSRIVNLFERMINSVEGSNEFEGEEEPGLWMPMTDARQPAAPGVTDTFTAPPATLLPDVRPAAPEASPAVDPLIDAGTPPPPELEERMPNIRIAAAAAEDIPETTVGPAPEPVEEDAPAADQASIPEEPLHTLPASEGSGSTDDMLSMFRSSTASTPFGNLAKDIEDVPAQELLVEALALRDLLIGSPAPTE